MFLQLWCLVLMPFWKLQCMMGCRWQPAAKLVTPSLIVMPGKVQCRWYAMAATLKVNAQISFHPLWPFLNATIAYHHHHHHHHCHHHHHRLCSLLPAFIVPSCLSSFLPPTVTLLPLWLSQACIEMENAWGDFGACYASGSLCCF